MDSRIKYGVNDSKFEALRYGTDEIIKLCTSYLTPSGSIITEKQEVRDLGVTMTNDCKFDVQITRIIESSKNMISWILCTFHTRKKEHMLMLWKSFVLPIIEYCSVLWCPSKVGNIQRIEALQWYFMRKLNVATNCNYWDVLKKLNLYSLQRRRDRYRIIYIWKILEQTTPNINESIQCYWHPRHGRKCKVF